MFTGQAQYLGPVEIHSMITQALTSYLHSEDPFPKAVSNVLEHQEAVMRVGGFVHSIFDAQLEWITGLVKAHLPTSNSKYNLYLQHSLLHGHVI